MPLWLPSHKWRDHRVAVKNHPHKNPSIEYEQRLSGNQCRMVDVYGSVIKRVVLRVVWHPTYPYYCELGQYKL